MSRNKKDQPMVQSAIGRTIDSIEQMSTYLNGVTVVMQNTGNLNLTAEQRIEIAERVLGLAATAVATVSAALVELDGKIEQLKDWHEQLHDIVIPTLENVPEPEPVDEAALDAAGEAAMREYRAKPGTPLRDYDADPVA